MNFNVSLKKNSETGNPEVTLNKGRIIILKTLWGAGSKSRIMDAGRVAYYYKEDWAVIGLLLGLR